MKKTYRSLLACCVLAVVILACSVGSPKTDASPSATPAAQQVTAASAGLITPEVVQPAELVGLWKTEDLRSPDNSWNTSYPVYFQFADTKQYVYHGEEAFTSNQPTDTSEIVYSNVADSTFVKKLIEIPDHPESLGKFQKWTWHFDNGKVLFTVYGMQDSQDLALKDNAITALATGVKVQPPQPAADTPVPPTQAAAIPASKEPMVIGDFELSFSNVTISENGFNGWVPANKTADDTVLTVEVLLISGDLKKLSSMKLSVTDDQGKRSESGTTLSVNDKNQVIWLIPVAKTARSFTLHFPSGEAVDLSTLLK